MCCIYSKIVWRASGKTCMKHGINSETDMQINKILDEFEFPSVAFHNPTGSSLVAPRSTNSMK